MHLQLWGRLLLFWSETYQFFEVRVKELMNVLQREDITFGDEIKRLQRSYSPYFNIWITRLCYFYILVFHRSMLVGSFRLVVKYHFLCIRQYHTFKSQTLQPLHTRSCFSFDFSSTKLIIQRSLQNRFENRVSVHIEEKAPIWF